MKVVVYYHPTLNPDNQSYPDVPLANLTAAEWEALPVWLQEAALASPFYSKKAPAKPPVTEESDHE